MSHPLSKHAVVPLILKFLNSSSHCFLISFSSPLAFSCLTILFHSLFHLPQYGFCVHNFTKRFSSWSSILITHPFPSFTDIAVLLLILLQISPLSKENHFLWLVTLHSSFASHILPLLFFGSLFRVDFSAIWIDVPFHAHSDLTIHFLFYALS